MPAVNGRFPQISGLCFAYEITGGAGGRVNVASAVRTDLAGNCTGPPVTFGALDSYTIAINDFIAGGGDSYPVVTGKPSYATRDLMDEVLADYITASTPVAPFVKAPPPAVNGRINCTDANGVLAANCPTLAPSFP